MRALPDFPWDALAPYGERARAHEDGIVDLSVGSPVDPAPEIVRAALAAASEAHSYPTTVGTDELRDAIVAWYARRRGVALERRNVLPSIGSKEFIAHLPLALGLGAGDTVVQPARAYPTYAVGAALVGADVHTGDDPAQWPDSTKLVWLCSPGNPDGRVLGVDELRAAVARARELDAVIVSDECYAELNWQGDEPTVSVLAPEVIDGSRHHILSLGSLSKQSNLAGYRAAFAAGCSRVLGRVLELRRHIGLMVPAPVQAAMVAALADDAHVLEQKERYRARRTILERALLDAGFTIDHSDGGLYLWAQRAPDAWATVDALADHGILVTPGTFYGDSSHVRIALTASDERVAAAAARLALLDK